MGPYIPTFELRVTLLFPSQAEAEWLANELVALYGGEAVVWHRLGERPNLTLAVLKRFGEQP